MGDLVENHNCFISSMSDLHLPVATSRSIILRMGVKSYFVSFRNKDGKDTSSDVATTEQPMPHML